MTKTTHEDDNLSAALAALSDGEAELELCAEHYGVDPKELRRAHIESLKTTRDPKPVRRSGKRKKPERSSQSAWESLTDEQVSTLVHIIGLADWQLAERYGVSIGVAADRIARLSPSAAQTSSDASERDAWTWQPISALATQLGVSPKQLDRLMRKDSRQVAHIERREALEHEREHVRQRYVVRVKPNGPARLLDAKDGWTDDPTGAGADVDARLNTGLHEKVTNLEAELENARATISRLEVEAQAAEDEAHLQASAVDASAGAIRAMLIEKDELATRIAEMEEERAADAATIEELRAKRDAHLKVIEAQDARTVELEQELADARERLASVHSGALFDLEEKLATLEQNQAGICAELDELDQAGVILSPLCAKSVIDWYRRRLA